MVVSSSQPICNRNPSVDCKKGWIVCFSLVAIYSAIKNGTGKKGGCLLINYGHSDCLPVTDTAVGLNIIQYPIHEAMKPRTYRTIRALDKAYMTEIKEICYQLAMSVAERDEYWHY